MTTLLTLAMLSTTRGASIVIEDDGHLVLEDNVTLVIDDSDDTELVVRQSRRGLQTAPKTRCKLERADTRCVRREGYHGSWPPSPGRDTTDAHESPEACARHMFTAMREAQVKAPIPIAYRRTGAESVCLSCWHQPTQLDNYMWKTTDYISEPATHVYRCSAADR